MMKLLFTMKKLKDLAAFRRCLEGFQRNLSQMTQEDDQ